MPQPQRPAHKPFKDYTPGYIHIDVKYLPLVYDEDRRRYLFVAIDRATRWVAIAIKSSKSARAKAALLRELA